jgi:hypothetical protein
MLKFIEVLLVIHNILHDYGDRGDDPDIFDEPPQPAEAEPDAQLAAHCTTLLGSYLSIPHFSLILPLLHLPPTHDVFSSQALFQPSNGWIDTRSPGHVFCNHIPPISTLKSKGTYQISSQDLNCK